MEDNDRKFKMLADAALKRPQAEIPPSEIEKVCNAVVDAVSRTKCASPNVDEVNGHIANNFTNILDKHTKAITKEASIEPLINRLLSAGLS